METAKHLLIVTVPAGLRINDTPRPQSQGAKVIRAVPVGAQLFAYSIHYIESVAYARLVPLNPKVPEWVRVTEADGNTRYADVIDIDSGDPTTFLASALTKLAEAIVRALSR